MAEFKGKVKNKISLNDDSVEKTEDYPKLIGYGLDIKVASKLDEIYRSGKLAHADLDKRAVYGLKELPIRAAVNVLTQFLESNLEYVSNKSAYLCGIMKTYWQKSRGGRTTVGRSAFTPARGPDEDKIKAILERTGYSLDVTITLRKYGGPPPNWDGPSPGPGCEVFVVIPDDIFEDELILLFENCGKIWELRLIMDPMTGTNRGYAFVTYTNKYEAQHATKDLHDYEIKPGKHLKVYISVANHRLFVGNIPKIKDKQEIMDEFNQYSGGLIDVIVYTFPNDEKKNRGFCFLEYESQKAASVARRRLGTGRVQIWGCNICVDWADLQDEPDSETMAAVKVLYVRNLKQECSEENLKEAFEVYGKVHRVKKMKSYAFIHFDEREHAVKAMDCLNGKDMGGSCIEVSLAKPPYNKTKKEEMFRTKRRRMMEIMQLRAGRSSGQHPIMIGPLPCGGPMPRDFVNDYYDYGDYRGGYSYYHDGYYGYNDYSPAVPPARGRAWPAQPGWRGTGCRGVMAPWVNNRFQQPQLWGAQTQCAPHCGYTYYHQPTRGSHFLPGECILDEGYQNHN